MTRALVQGETRPCFYSISFFSFILPLTMLRLVISKELKLRVA